MGSLGDAVRQMAADLEEVTNGALKKRERQVAHLKAEQASLQATSQERNARAERELVEVRGYVAAAETVRDKQAARSKELEARLEDTTHRWQKLREENNDLRVDHGNKVRLISQHHNISNPIVLDLFYLTLSSHSASHHVSRPSHPVVTLSHTPACLASLF